MLSQPDLSHNIQGPERSSGSSTPENHVFPGDIMTGKTDKYLVSWTTTENTRASVLFAGLVRVPAPKTLR